MLRPVHYVAAFWLEMDARGAAAARAVGLVVRQANDAAVAENVRLRRAIERAAAAVSEGDRALALRLLALALDGSPVPVVPPRARGQFCVLCTVRRRSLVQMPATGRWVALPAHERLLCRACFLLQPPQ